MMAKNIKRGGIKAKITGRKPRIYRSCVVADKSYRESLERLSYKQLLRINTVVCATSEREKEASKLFIRRLTPPEMKVVKSIQNESVPSQRTRKIRLLKDTQQRKNRMEIEGIDIDAIIDSAKKQEDM